MLFGEKTKRENFFIFKGAYSCYYHIYMLQYSIHKRLCSLYDKNPINWTP